jgi:DNA-binding NtrC family response regulator
MSIKVLVVDDKQMMRDSVGATLQRAGFAVVAAPNGKVGLQMVAKHRPAAVVTDLKMPEMDGLELLRNLNEADDSLPVVLMTAFGTVNDAVDAMKHGAFDFVQKPFDGEQLVMTVKRAVEHRKLVTENAALKTSQADAAEGSASHPLVGRSAAMQRVAAQVQQVADCDGTVLIQGESGTGKEVVARALHAASPRADKVMLCLNCAALSSSLLESELFGHERGAFTGADQQRKGRFELADGGTLLLDEVSEISPQLQAKLLRVLQEGQFERVGASQTMRVDVRIIATTNRDLVRAVADGTFRQDLYYRLNVLPIVLPPLRERSGDVALLAEHFLDRLASRSGSVAKRFDDAAVSLMQRYPWPGNVRELQNICERAHVLSASERIEAGVIEPWLAAAPVPPTPTVASATAAAPAGSPALQAPVWSSQSASPTEVKPLEQVEREQILHTLETFDGNRTRTAEALGIGVRTLGLKLKRWKQENLIAQSV